MSYDALKPVSYDALKRLLGGEPLPTALVDLDALDRNAESFIAEVPAAKRFRLATKSIRVPWLLRYLLDRWPGRFEGLMCYSACELRYLAEEGFDDLLLAYPALQARDLEAIHAAACAGKRVAIMVDEPAHLERIEAYWKRYARGATLGLCVDLDVSYRPFPGIHLGARRSPLRRLDEASRLIESIRRKESFRLAGVMAYEAQIAGVPDRSPFSRLRNPFIRLMKRLSVKDVAKKREALHRYLEREGITLDFFNAGGSGSFVTSLREPWVTEVTLGSGLLQPHLFDYYQGQCRRPALAFALAVTRIPEPGVVTCHSGGFVASGAAGPDKLPLPWLPEGLRLFPAEGAGEVQTPLRHSGAIALGDPIFFRPAKAGEIAERFAFYHLKRGDAFIGRAPTYRGLGQIFY